VTEPQEPRGAAAEHPTVDELSDYAYSPQEAAAGLREHLEGCAQCTTEVGEIHALLASLADLPEPALPASVGIRAWQEADAQQERLGSERPGRRRGSIWRKTALPVGALCLLALGAVGVGELVGHGSASSPSASGAAAPAVAGDSPPGDAALSAWVHTVLAELPSAGTSASTTTPSHALQPKATEPRRSAGVNSAMSGFECQSAPRREGFTVLSAVSKPFRGQQATLVVYGYSGEPASATVYAVVYAGSCPTTPSEILDQGSVSR